MAKPAPGAPHNPRMATADHVVRACDGGRIERGNIVAACAKCNNERHVDDDREQARDRTLRTTGDVFRSPFQCLEVLKQGEKDGDGQTQAD